MAIPLYRCRLKILKLYDKDKILEANLRKAPKLTNSVFHPSNSKQNVHLAIALFHEMTVAAFENYLATWEIWCIWISENVFVLVDDIKCKTKVHSQ